MDPIILTVVIASSVAFLFVLAWKLVWFLRKIAEDPGVDRGEDRVEGPSDGRDPSAD